MARPSGAKQPVPVDQRVCAAVRRAVLPNGIRVITDTTAAAGNVAAISIAIQAGARQEMPSESGLANLTAQVAMLETVSQTALERARQGERWRAGVEVDSEHTIFRATADAASVAAAMAHLAEAIQNATCGPATIELERRAILRGIEMAGAAPARQTRMLLRSAVWRDHGLGRPVAGNAVSLSHLDRMRLLGFLDRHYTASNLIVAAAGAVDHEAVAEAAARAFGRMRTVAKRGRDVSPIWHGEAIHKHIATKECHFALGFPGVEHGHRLGAAHELLARVTGGGAQSRMYRRLKIERNLVERIESSYQGYADTGIWVIEGRTAPQKEVAAVRGVLEELESYASVRPVTEEELWLASRDLEEAQQAAARDLAGRARLLAIDESRGGDPTATRFRMPLGAEMAAETIGLARRALKVWLPDVAVARVGPIEVGPAGMMAHRSKAACRGTLQ